MPQYGRNKETIIKHELLAPAGSLEAGYAALHYGADAVYLGLTKFSARAGAENFTPEELDEFTAYAHTLGRKVFVALEENASGRGTACKHTDGGA